MIDAARATGVYDELAVADLVSFLRGRTGVDLGVAADVFVYLGDLRPALARAAAALAPGGLLAFTVESGDAPFALGPALRFRHSEAHVREAASATGLAVRHLAQAATRREAGVEAQALLVVLGNGA